MSRSPSAQSSRAGLTLRVVREAAELAALSADWADLYARSSAATPFQSFGWLRSWWRVYGTPGRLRVFLAHRGGRLVAAAPFRLEYRSGCRALTPVGGAQSDFTDIVVDDSEGDAGLGELRAALLTQPGWDVIDLPEVRPGAAAGRLAELWAGRTWTLPASTCLQLPGRPVDEVLAGLSTRRARRLRSALRKLDALDVSAVSVGPDQVERAMTELLRLHALQWANRPINAQHTQPRFMDHLVRAARAMVADGHAALTEYRIRGRLLASDFVVVGKDFVGGYLYGVHPELRAEVDVLTMLLRQNLGIAHRLGKPVLSMLRGDEPYKAKWECLAVANRRVLLGHGVRASGYAATAGMRRATRDLLRRRCPRLAERVATWR
ncbi:GNAT family N-acetyltransferase [Nonomuraea jiangxiensis]|uniref:Acetyltransferase involved in cellulose biosynthesis, CelD/BcsL family n=1 Tax=Nonomuraea jiangxiensis TaxID=633440 RepID=A0A1G9P7J9_9ACTN|nr:GNAT family N-acetyltransferase [Nonomuraea jiangxiensis]SDL94768.1 Acetyltransferase involved in cellulose biosynthesis, CelD/BcsL family [Nonomuraea jiangxiensis]